MKPNNDLTSMLHKNQRQLFRNLRGQIKDLNEMLQTVANAQDVDAVRREHMEFLGVVGCRMLTDKEAELAKEGISFDDLRRMCGKKIDACITRDALRDTIPHSHLVRRILAEHEMMLCFVSDLARSNLELLKLGGWDENPKLIDKIVSCIKSIGLLDSHYQREERVIMPQLRSYGLKDVPQTVCQEHQEIHNARAEMKKLVDAAGKMDFKEWQGRIAIVVSHFVPLIRAHIKFEETSLYPNALKLIQDPIKWETMKLACDELDICCFEE